MIFDKLFSGRKNRSKWKHQDPNVRIEAVTELQPDDQEQKNLLKELAFNDSANLVRRAALIRLNDFSLWWQASKASQDNRLAQYAMQQVEDALLGKSECQVEPSLKRQFIQECNKSALLEAIARQDSDLASQQMAIEKLNKPKLNQELIGDTGFDESLALQLLAEIDDLAVLEKLAKKLSGERQRVAQSLLSAKVEAAEKPLKLQKQVGLLLAKLKALGDKRDFVEVQQKQADFNTQWQALSVDFDCLDPELAQEYQEKFSHISDGLKRIFADREKQHQVELAQAAAQQARDDVEASISARLDEVKQTVVTALEKGEEVNESALNETLHQLTHKVQHSELEPKSQHRWLAAIEECANDIAASASLLQHKESLSALLSELDAHPLPEVAGVEDDAFFSQWLARWNQEKRGASHWFRELVQRGESAVSQWKARLNVLHQADKAKQSEVRKKLAEIKRLHRMGRYRAVFAVSYKLKELMADYQPNEKLAREVAQAEELVDELHELQAYVATPRKQALLQEVLDKVEQPLESPADQAEYVKQARKTWLSLGHAEPELEKTLNQAFDEACEKAFEICRNYYAEQEALRAENLKHKQALVEELEQIGLPELDDHKTWHQIEKSVQRIQTRWREIGQVDRKAFKPLIEAFNQGVSRLREGLKAYHEQNARAKQALIERAKEALTLDDLDACINQLKDIQQKWKQLGFAGAGQDQALWKSFRSLNDQGFARRDEQKQQHEAAQGALLNDLNVLLEQSDSLALSALRDGLAGVLEKHSDIRAGAQASALIKKLNTLAQQKQQQASLKARQDQLHAFCSDIEACINGEAGKQGIPEHKVSSSDAAEQHKQLLMLEMNLGIQVPDEDLELVKQLKVMMMAKKLQEGQLEGAEELMKRWLSFGLPHSVESPEWQRFKRAVLA